MQSALANVLQRLARIDEQLADRAPASEVQRLDHAFELIAELRSDLTSTAPATEIERLNHAFELIADRAPASEVQRLDHAFELIAELRSDLTSTAPATEIERLNHAFELIGHTARLTDLRELAVSHRPSERVVEVPWVLGKYAGERRVLEVGYAFAEDYYLRALENLGIPFLVGVDPAVSPRSSDTLEPLIEVRGDVLVSCFRPSSFDLILCVSTIEHIGRDNSVYGLDTGRDIDRPDVAVMENMSKWLVPGGRILLTVPFGRYEDHGWLINYDRTHLEGLTASSGLEVIEMRFFGWRPGGWREVEAGDLTENGYKALGAAHASGVALVELQASAEET